MRRCALPLPHLGSLPVCKRPKRNCRKCRLPLQTPGVCFFCRPTQKVSRSGSYRFGCSRRGVSERGLTFSISAICSIASVMGFAAVPVLRESLLVDTRMSALSDTVRISEHNERTDLRFLSIVSCGFYHLELFGFMLALWDLDVFLHHCSDKWHGFCKLTVYGCRRNKLPSVWQAV